MHRKPNPDTPSGAPEHAFDQALLDLLTLDHPGLWSLTELTRSLTPSDQYADRPTPDTEDAIERLHAAGLIHRIDHYIFATRAAHTAQRLAS